MKVDTEARRPSKCHLGCQPDTMAQPGLGLFTRERAPTNTTPLVTCGYSLSTSFPFANIQLSVAVSSQEFKPTRDGTDIFLLVNDLFVFSARPFEGPSGPNEGCPPGFIGMSDAQRTWANIGIRDDVKVQIYDPFSQGGQAYLGSADIEVSFASSLPKKRPETPYDQDELAQAVIKVS